MSSAAQPLFVTLHQPKASILAQMAVGMKGDRGCYKQMVVTLHDCVWERKRQGLFFLTILFFPRMLGFFF